MKSKKKTKFNELIMKDDVERLGYNKVLLKLRWMFDKISYISSKIHRYSNNTFQEFEVPKKAFITEA